MKHSPECDDMRCYCIPDQFKHSGVCGMPIKGGICPKPGGHQEDCSLGLEIQPDSKLYILAMAICLLIVCVYAEFRR